MPIGFQNFQLLLAAVMIAGLLVLLIPLVRVATHARLPRASVILVLVPVVGVVWLCLVARAMTPGREAREEA